MIKKYIPQQLINYSKHLPDAAIANIKYGFPGRKIKVIAVTGTDGKTTTVNMIYSILKTAGKKVSMLSTINATIAGKSYDTGFHVTSPKPADIQKYLKMAVDHKDEFMILEVTSHALDQYRSWGIPIEIGVITNITHEHLDYHKTFANYLKTKAKLIQKSKIAILNQDDPNFAKLEKMAAGKVTSFGLHSNAMINPKNYVLGLKLPGSYNYANALAAAAVAENLGIEKKLTVRALNGFDSLVGRMEVVTDNLKYRPNFKVVVDFAHTPHALEEALETLRHETQSKVICIFGAASERDTAKRPMMGQIAAKLANTVILTSEDPRVEDPQKIIDEIAVGAFSFGAKLGKDLFFEPDRKQAILLGLSKAMPGDTVGIFGKGHEKTMNIGGKELPWSDQAEVIKYFKSKKKAS